MKENHQLGYDRARHFAGQSIINFRIAVNAFLFAIAFVSALGQIVTGQHGGRS
jgi:hypothetical protein